MVSHMKMCKMTLYLARKTPPNVLSGTKVGDPCEGDARSILRDSGSVTAPLRSGLHVPLNSRSVRRQGSLSPHHPWRPSMVHLTTGHGYWFALSYFRGLGFGHPLEATKPTQCTCCVSDCPINGLPWLPSIGVSEG